VLDKNLFRFREGEVAVSPVEAVWFVICVPIDCTDCREFARLMLPKDLFPFCNFWRMKPVSKLEGANSYSMLS